MSNFSLCPGATTAPSLIFILPGLFYIRIVPTEQEPMNSKPKLQVGLHMIVLTLYLPFFLIALCFCNDHVQNDQMYLVLGQSGPMWCTSNN